MARVALVTGGMGGLGEAVCIKLAALGYTVVTTHSPGNTKAESWLAAMREQGYNFKAYPCDVADYDSAQACVKQVEQEVGPVDVLVNNAGITRDRMFLKMSPEDWQAVIDTNLNSMFNVTKQVVPDMVEKGWGRIVQISSVNGEKGQAGQTNYSAAKAGMHGFTKALALEVAPLGIKVTAVEPGFFRTEFLDPSSVRYGANVIEDYAAQGSIAQTYGAYKGRQLGDPAKLAAAVRALADIAAPPRRFLAGSDAVAMAEAELEARRNDMAAMRALSLSTDHGD